MKVVYIADIGIAGGATKSLVEMISTLKTEYNVEPVVLTSRNDELNDVLTRNGIENHSVGHGAFMQGAPDSLWKKPIKWLLYGGIYYGRFYSSLKKAMSVVDWGTVDLIHTNVARDDIGMEISKRTGIPNVCHIREFAELDFNCWSYRTNYVKYLAKNTNGFIAISDAVKQYWVMKGLPQDKIHVVYNGVDNRKIKAVNYDTWKTDKILKMVIVGGVIPNKGQWQAIQALCKLPLEVRRNVTIDVIGGITESYKDRISEPLKNAGIENQVNFLGSCVDVYDRLCSYHIGLMCSKAEGFGRVTVEYMHAGLGVIASNSGANPELIVDGKTGILYDRNNIDSLVQAIEKLVLNRDELISIAQAGKKSVQKFTKEDNAENIYKYYLSVMHNVGDR